MPEGVAVVRGEAGNVVVENISDSQQASDEFMESLKKDKAPSRQGLVDFWDETLKDDNASD
jgi:hypothetical protein